MEMYRQLLIAAALLLSSAAVVRGDWSTCGAPDGSTQSFEIAGCQAPARCVLKKGTEAKVSILFSSKVASKGVKVKAFGVIHEVPIPFPLPQKDACQCGVTCPIQENGNYTYHSSFPIKAEYPSLSLDVKWELIDDDGKNLVCQLVPVEITS
ncbi:NPC intracellular cholesterol transporter 2-like [Haemaphysalis longicornis]|uniref:MD-2-related lipid-recognition domain-containing protein n=1 Tax=Haemaphysalis longicornis TaxID=44386 RepID=A0A9J6FIE3_HAELO|nr:hypothetical protein HPB48_001188 [Haemaphysalis longicornis]